MPKPDTVTMSMEMFERMTNAMNCELCIFHGYDTNSCTGYKTCREAFEALIKADNKEKGIEDE